MNMMISYQELVRTFLNPQPQSGRQELLENLVNTYIFG